MPPTKPKRRRRGVSSRGRKKQKRLDAIRDVAPPPPPLAPLGGVGIGGGDDDSNPESIRRGTRVRRAPVVLDASPLPSPRRKRPRRGDQLGSSGSSRWERRGRARHEADARAMEEEDNDEGSVVWRSRLRDMVKGKAKLEGRARSLWFGDEEYEEDEDEHEEARMVVVDVRERAVDDEVSKESAGLQLVGRELTNREINLTINLNVDAHEAMESINAVEKGERARGEKVEEEKVAAEQEQEVEGPTVGTRNDVEKVMGDEMVVEEGLQLDKETGGLELPVLVGNGGDKLPCENNEEARASSSGRIEMLDMISEQIAEENKHLAEQQMELDPSSPDEQAEEVQKDEQLVHVPDEVLAEDAPKESMRNSPVLDEKRGVKVVKEGTRCGLCGGGTDGRLPKTASDNSVDCENEAYEGALPSEEPNYDMWDGFGDDPGWLGRFLGPIHDRFGIARVWVHQNCAVWSPEVYFAGLGCLRNVRAALCRGRLLKCSHCGRSGATIGCRVDRCPKTYHLPCSRTEACAFDHWKFLIACNDHRHLFQPQGDEKSLSKNRLLGPLKKEKEHIFMKLKQEEMGKDNERRGIGFFMREQEQIRPEIEKKAQHSQKNNSSNQIPQCDKKRDQDVIDTDGNKRHLIHIKHMDGWKSLFVDTSCSSLSLKKLIESDMGYSLDNFTLKFGSKLLYDKRSLNSHGISLNSIQDLYPKLLGGCESDSTLMDFIGSNIGLVITIHLPDPYDTNKIQVVENLSPAGCRLAKSIVDIFVKASLKKKTWRGAISISDFKVHLGRAEVTKQPREA